MAIIETTPFDDQQPGTSGLRKKVAVFQQPHYAENFLQAIFDNLGDIEGATLVLGGDGRYYNREVIQKALAMGIANGFGRIVVGRSGLLSTPAASHLIIREGAIGGIILSASHNPGGPDGDFGIKFNIANGGPAPVQVTEAVHRSASSITRFRKAEIDPLDLEREGEHSIGGTRIVVIDPVRGYAELMESLFDFDAIRQLFAGGFTMLFDAMHAVTGPYAREIFVNRLGASPDSLLNCEPKEDFGGGHPDPNKVHARQLVDRMLGEDAPDFGAASDGDGDRNMILGRGMPVSPSDSLALLAANAKLIPAYRDGIKGIARSMPTSSAADRVAAALGLPLYETPTGWKFFGNLLDAGMVSICGEESAGTGGDHIREKDGLWAVLFWLNILARRGQPVREIMEDHWRSYGRNYYTRYDYESLDPEAAQRVIGSLRQELAELAGCACGPFRIVEADDFAYRDPVDGSLTTGQGIRIFFSEGARAVFRLSGTGTEGATLRIYLERYHPPGGDQWPPADVILAPLAQAALQLARVSEFTGRDRPSLIA